MAPAVTVDENAKSRLEELQAESRLRPGTNAIRGETAYADHRRGMRIARRRPLQITVIVNTGVRYADKNIDARRLDAASEAFNAVYVEAGTMNQFPPPSGAGRRPTR